MNTSLYENIVESLVEKQYIVLKDALSKELISSLLDFAISSKAFNHAGISQEKTHIDNSKRCDKSLWLEEDNGVQSEYLLFMQNLQEYLNRSLYLGLHYYESHFTLYEAGDFYEKHLDAFKGSKNRIVTTVLYLNKEYKKEDAGELVIYNESDEELIKVKPEAGTLVVFMSEKFPHEVLPSSALRYSIAGWFRVD